MTNISNRHVYSHNFSRRIETIQSVFFIKLVTAAFLLSRDLIQARVRRHRGVIYAATEDNITFVLFVGTWYLINPIVELVDINCDSMVTQVLPVENPSRYVLVAIKL